MRREDTDESDWQLPYIAMMFLIISFFAALVAIGSISKERLKEALGSIREYLGVSSEALKEISEKRKQLLEKLKEIEGPDIETRITAEGVILDIKSPIFFDIASAELKPSAYPIIKKVVEIAKIVNPYEIEVCGHTCDLPIHTAQFNSNWELSQARALSVVRALRKKLPKMHFSATGYGEYRPKVENIDEEHRKLNRRVEIYLRYGRKR